MSEKKVVKKVQKKPVEKPKQPVRVSTSSYSTRPKIKRTHDTPSWSFGWEGPSKDEFANNSSFMRYHNASSVMIGDKSSAFEDNKKDQMRKTKTEELNAKLPTYDPKTANRSQIVFGDQKPDFSKKSNVVSSPTRVPPGGKSQIIFG